MKIRLAAELQPDSIVDGEGIRTVIWTQGCPHHCKGCHNPSTHDFNGGLDIDIEKIKKELKQIQYQDGITFSGGDPFCQPKECMEIAKYAKKLDMNVWCYTGYTFEQLMVLSKKNEDILSFLNQIDVLIDGKFILAEKSFDVAFRGSKNQRIIDVQKSLKQNRVVIIQKYDHKQLETNSLHEQYLFI